LREKITRNQKKIILKKYLRLVIFVLSGTALGYGYYHFFGCEGSCPLTSKWYVTTAYGSLAGLLFGLPVKKNNTESKKDS
jgi:hypothetical protein